MFNTGPSCPNCEHPLEVGIVCSLDFATGASVDYSLCTHSATCQHCHWHGMVEGHGGHQCEPFTVIDHRRIDQLGDDIWK